ncbi:hypothetical protein JA1_000788 [Spathaspora sp. JA1]|nr:hypothetical protein JA1_000788 [Spathaspora sp. JA1]
MTSIAALSIPDEIPQRSPARLLKQRNSQYGLNILKSRINNKHRQQESITSIATFDSMSSDASSFESTSGSSSIFSIEKKVNEKEEEYNEEDQEFFDVIEDAEIHSIDGIQTIVGVHCLSNSEFNQNNDVNLARLVQF